jgi:hypothetical protein
MRFRDWACGRNYGRAESRGFDERKNNVDEHDGYLGELVEYLNIFDDGCR